MNEHKPIALNLTSEWENIVNKSPHRTARKDREAGMQEQVQSRRLDKAILITCVAAVAVMLNFFGLVSAWVAHPIAIACLLVTSFIVGRIWEGMGK